MFPEKEGEKKKEIRTERRQEENSGFKPTKNIIIFNSVHFHLLSL